MHKYDNTLQKHFENLQFIIKNKIKDPLIEPIMSDKNEVKVHISEILELNT